MAKVYVEGEVLNAGANETGAWFVVGEPWKRKDGSLVTKDNGELIFTRYMCSGDKAPAVGTHVTVNGFLRAEVREFDGKHYPDLKIQAARWESKSIEEELSKHGKVREANDDDVPF